MLFDLLYRSPEKEKPAGDSKLKSIFKAISWRVIGTLDTILISYLITGKAAVAISIGSIETFTKIFLYFLHERLWNGLGVLKTKRA